MTKKCNDCGGEFEKEIMFHSKSAGRCIPCYKLSLKRRYENNKESIKEKARAYYQNMNKEQKQRSNELRKIRLKDNRESRLEYNRKWHHENKDRLKAEGKCWNTNNKDRVKTRRKIRESTPEYKAKKLAYQRDYSIKNKDKILAKDKKWESIPKNKVGRRLRCRVRSALKNNLGSINPKKIDTTQKLLGISYQDFVNYIESMFIDNMSWDNYGEWHLDHIIPCAKFDLVLEEDQRICFNYQNYQPLWGEENHRKSDNILIDNPSEFIDNIRKSLSIIE